MVQSWYQNTAQRWYHLRDTIGYHSNTIVTSHASRTGLPIVLFSCTFRAWPSRHLYSH